MDLLDNVYGGPQGPKAPLPVRIGKLLMGKLFLSIAVSGSVAAMMQMGYLRWIVVTLCHVIILIFGKGEAPKPIKEKMDVVFEKAKEAAPSLIPQRLANAPKPASTSTEPEAKPAPVGFVAKFEEKVSEKVGEKVAPVKAAAVKATKKVEEKAVEAKETVKEEAKKVGEKLDALKGKFGDKDGAAPGGDPAGEGELEGVEGAGRMEEIARQRAGRAKVANTRAPNGQCPRCHRPVRVPTSGSQRYFCPCGYVYTGRAARHLGPPGMPSMPSLPKPPAEIFR